jgi:branched-chain amino acid aminotransferase
METIYSLDFKKTDREKAVVSVMDRGFLYGDSIYEAVRTYKGRLFLLEAHFERLLNSASRLKIKVPFSCEELKSHLNDMAGHFNFDAYIRVIVTRGEDSVFDLYPGSPLNPKTIVAVRKIHEYPAEYYSKGISLANVSVRRNSKTALDPEIKSGNYLNNIMAIMEAKAKGANDALMVNENGHVTECTTSNFFAVRDGVAITPRLDAGLLHGVTRQFLIEIMAKEKISFKEANLSAKEVQASDECFISATTKEIMPVTSIDGKKIGKGEVGPVTKKLIDLFHKEAYRKVGL